MLRQRYKQLVLTTMRKCLIEEEWDESGPSGTNSLCIVAEDVILETHEGEDMIVVLFRRGLAALVLCTGSGCRRWSRKKILGAA